MLVFQILVVVRLTSKGGTEELEATRCHYSSKKTKLRWITWITKRMWCLLLVKEASIETGDSPRLLQENYLSVWIAGKDVIWTHKDSLVSEFGRGRK